MKRIGPLLLVLPLVSAACGTANSGTADSGTARSVRPGDLPPGLEVGPTRPELGGLRPDADGVLFRLFVRGPGDDVRLTLENDGRMVRVDDTSVLSSTADYTTWRLGPGGVERLVEEVEGSGVLSMLNTGFGDADPGSGRSVGFFYGGGRVVEAHDLDRRTGFDAATLARRQQLAQLVDRLIDLDWLAGEIVEARGPFVPEALTVLARAPSPRSGLRPEDPFRPWPFGRPVEAMAQSTQTGPSGEEQLVVCLTGPDVAPLFALLTGVNHAYLRVDDGRRWELNVQPHTPGYRLLGDACAPARPPSAPIEIKTKEAGMRQLLVTLLDDLETVGEEHEEVYDTDVRERMADALVRGFVDREAGYALPTEYAMFSPAGNQAVRGALQAYLAAALPEGQGLNGRQARLDAVWDYGTTSASGASVDDFFGDVS